MEIILKLMGAALGILVPALFIYAISNGISNSALPDEKKKSSRLMLYLLMLIWATIIWVLSIQGVFSYHSGDSLPRFLAPLFIPVLIGFSFLLSKTFRIILDSLPLSLLVGVQAFRLAGFAFLIIANMGILPSAFSSGGYGDILTGILAIIVAKLLSQNGKNARFCFYAFTIVGLLDLLNVAFLLLYYYPGWNHSGISSAAAFDFSLIMIPAIAAPLALLLHFYSVRNFLFKKTESWKLK